MLRAGRVALFRAPSVLPDISPTRGEIGSFIEGAIFATMMIGESRRDIRSPPVWGSCPAGKRGARRITAQKAAP